ncbi:TIGR00159 family protein [Chitinophaga costaii]|uniref:Diadenylate cyclase n=1 Tax=Chitinophaga costaii TaxID=1335309 RepID=A0A1C4FD87_9BACT|nr:diadenylate cyclase [Chitinophaga costaii]PUZ20661.1 diadenylate cyclase [Chitinophaga costaii]SCC53959.1 TIGR00159 family protein [Chitinophaga costaii]
MKDVIHFYGFNFRWLNVLDLLIVVFLVIQLYRLLKGSLAFNIFLGLLVVYAVYFLVRFLGMPILSNILQNFINVGIIAIIIIFQPEIRKFLLVLGKKTPLSKDSFLTKLFLPDKFKSYREEENIINEIVMAASHMASRKTGALIIIATTYRLKFDSASSTTIDGNVSARLIECIFEKSSPLHDGALIIVGNRILAAKVILPVSDNPDLPSRIGLRHRSAVGITEHSDNLAIVVSEERGTISYAEDGELSMDVSPEDLKVKLYTLLIDGYA